ncbi:hypothetical protein A4A49_29382 [Nicotiana attenuata]|uniref:Uncharacterized protein n=1 Tax=Nicotiana attenuata TaxID=49451 RepID=A0A1J6K418_NICAT|nr:hypothetical protein A4A49_29382 [Nicotiana attenuata]
MHTETMEPWKDLSGKLVMVTGASSGTGREFCLDLAKVGCSIIAAARRIDRLKSLCDHINNSEDTQRAIAIQLDVTTDGSTIQAAVERAWDAFGRIDALVNNAGLKGAVAYASSKMALDMVTKMMALELGVDKIRVNSISPGIFKSEITESLVQKEWFNNVTLRTIPLKTLGTTDPALTSVVRYLIHDSSEYVSGNVFIVDAGTTFVGGSHFLITVDKENGHVRDNTVLVLSQF